MCSTHLCGSANACHVIPGNLQIHSMQVDTYCVFIVTGIMCDISDGVFTRAVQKVSSDFEYLENWLSGLDITWQLVRRDLTVRP